MLWVIGVLAILGAALCGPIMSNVEQAKYTVVESHGDTEIRDYAPCIAAYVEVSGEREIAIREGFRLIADYIFGNNDSAKKVAMTAPVLQQQRQKIAMTAPVMQSEANGKWEVRFVMPASYTMATLPRPKNSAVRLEEIPAKRFAVIRFSGLAGNKSLKQHLEKLDAFIDSQKLHVVAAPIYAFFNPPWTLPFLRRNEVMLEVAK